MSESSRSALGFLVATFAMLWVPVGQHAFLVPNWMKFGTFLAPFLLFIAVAFRPANAGPVHRDLRVLSLWMLVAYLIHQFEEHWIDLEGNVYAFHASVNELLMGVFGLDTGPGPLTPEGIFVINTSLVWLVGAIAVWRAPHHRFPALAMASIIVVNAIAHIGLGIVRLDYNPGLLTSLIVFLPIGGYVYAFVRQANLASTREVLASVAWGVIAHIIMVGGLVLGQIQGLFPESVYFLALGIWSVVPTFLFVPSAGRS
ncbi:MAG: HXXEE domain-containing protein [Myxococcota bacterium]